VVYRVSVARRPAFWRGVVRDNVRVSGDELPEVIDGLQGQFWAIATILELLVGAMPAQVVAVYA
jgi:hypothetical protein